MGPSTAENMLWVSVGPVPRDHIFTRGVLKQQLNQAATASQLKAQQLASVIGKIISMSLAIGPVAHLMTRSMYALLNTQQYWCRTLTLSPEVIRELSFWQSQISGIDGWEIWQSPSAVSRCTQKPVTQAMGDSQ